MIRDEAFLREQIAYCTDYYRQVRPGSRAAAEVIGDQQRFRNELAALLRSERRNRTDSESAAPASKPSVKTSYLVIAVGGSRGLLAQAYARDIAAAAAAVRAAFVDSHGEPCDAEVIDEEAMPGLWVEGDAAYVRHCLTEIRAQSAFNHPR